MIAYALDRQLRNFHMKRPKDHSTSSMSKTEVSGHDKNTAMIKRTGIFSLIILIGFIGADNINSQSYSEFIEVKRISDKVILLTGVPLPAGCQVTAISSEQGIVVVDTTGSWSLAREFKQIIEKEFRRDDFTFIINTHDHPDHTNGNRVFTDAIIIGHEQCRKAMQKRKTKWTNDFMSKSIHQIEIQIDQLKSKISSLPLDSPQVETIRRQISSLRCALSDAESISDEDIGSVIIPPELTFTDKITLNLGDVTVNIYDFSDYHSDSDIFIHIPEEGILIIGDTLSDAYLPGASLNVRKVNVAHWLSTLDAVLAEKGKVIHAIRGHTSILSIEVIDAVREYLVELWTGINKAQVSGIGIDSIQKQFPLERFSYITKYIKRDDVQLRDQHRIIVQGFWRQCQNKIFSYEELMDTMQDIDIDTSEGRNVLIELYRDMVSNQNEYFFHEELINDYANIFIKSGAIDEAIELMGLHVEVFAESSAAYATLGNAYLAAGDIKLAMKNLQRSLKLDPENRSVKETLRIIKEKHNEH